MREPVASPIIIFSAGDAAEHGVGEGDVVEDDDDLALIFPGELGQGVGEVGHNGLFGLVGAVGDHGPVDEDRGGRFADIFRVHLVEIHIDILGQGAGVGADALGGELHKFALLGCGLATCDGDMNDRHFLILLIKFGARGRRWGLAHEKSDPAESGGAAAAVGDVGLRSGGCRGKDLRHFSALERGCQGQDRNSSDKNRRDQNHVNQNQGGICPGGNGTGGLCCGAAFAGGICHD